VKFVVDANLGRLVKWLRILGYDTTYWKGDTDRDFLRKAQREGRIVLTRRRDLARRQYAGALIVIEADHLEEQLRELLEKVALRPDPDRFLRICLRCNESLAQVRKEDVEGMVPAYVLETNETFFACPRCGGIFWPGTHRKNMLLFLTKRIPSGRP
jgi:uncharacterized protein with PIN domain